MNYERKWNDELLNSKRKLNEKSTIRKSHIVQKQEVKNPTRVIFAQVQKKIMKNERI